MNVINQIERATVVDGGCTYSLSAGEMILPGSPLYVISLHKAEEEIILLDDFDVTKIRMFIIKNSAELWQPNIAIGTWVHEGQVYLDIVSLFDKGQTGLEELHSISTDQLAAWDMDTNEVVTLVKQEQ